MSDPSVVLGVNVRNVRMTFLVHGNVVLGRGSVVLTAGRLGSPCGSRTASRNVSTANRRGATAAAWAPHRLPYSAQKQPGKIEPMAL